VSDTPPISAEPGADIDVRHLLNAQTGRIGWTELQRQFAQGLLLWVAPELDLVEVAAHIVKDDRAMVTAWLETGKLVKPDLAMAHDWQQSQPEFWAVVAAPWVLVQETRNT
jgi:hypothetical protein